MTICIQIKMFYNTEHFAMNAKRFQFAGKLFLYAVSKALEKSTKQQYNFSFLWNCLSVSVFKTNKLFEVLMFGLNPII